MGAPERIVVFSKTPVPGRVKTRLAGDLGTEGAARIYRAFLADTLRALFTDPGRCGTLACDPAPDDFMRRLAASWRLDLERQEGADLTERCVNALLAARARGAERVLFAGADCPTLPRRFIDLAFTRLEGGADVVLGPSFDGGYTLSGLGPRAEAGVVFADVPWDTERALAATRANIERSGLRIAFVPTWYDVDDPAGLAYLEGHLALLDPSSASGAPETRRALREIRGGGSAPPGGA
jgi:rSAM/selenodomain-associated transferase 1